MEIVVINIEATEINMIIADILDNGLKNIKSVETKKHSGIENYNFIDPTGVANVIKSLLSSYQKKVFLTKLFISISPQLSHFPFVAYQKDYQKNTKITDKTYAALLDDAILSLEAPAEWIPMDIHPIEFVINGQSRCTDIRGLTLSRVELISTVSCYKEQTLNLIKDTVSRLGIVDVYYFSACQAVNKYFFGALPLDRQEVMLEITAAAITLSVYKGVAVIKTQSLEHGANEVVEQLAYAFGVQGDVGERLLDKFNLAYEYDSFDIITVEAHGDQYSFYVNDIFKIVNKVLDEICAKIKFNMENSDIMIPPFAIINMIGSGMKIKGLKEYFSAKLERDINVLSPNMKGWELPIYARIVAVVEYVQELVETNGSVINKLKKIFTR